MLVHRTVLECAVPMGFASVADPIGTLPDLSCILQCSCGLEVVLYLLDGDHAPTEANPAHSIPGGDCPHSGAHGKAFDSIHIAT